jgi:hypothetical protein
MHDILPYFGIGAIVFCVAFWLYLKWKKKPAKFVDILNKNVFFEGKKGVIVHQEDTKLFINWTNNYGALIQSIRHIEQVEVLPD